MTTDVQAVIRALTKTPEPKRNKASSEPRIPVITISRTMGSGGNEIAAKLARVLGVECYGKEILDAVAKRAKVDKALMNKLHERTSKASDAWLYALVFGKNVTRDAYLQAVTSTMRGLYKLGGVIVGRGGHIVLAGRRVFRVRIIGSVEACARRIALQEHIDLAEAKKRVRESNRVRGQFMWNIFAVRANDPANFDLVINSDRFTDYDRIVELIVHGLQSLELDAPPTGKAS